MKQPMTVKQLRQLLAQQPDKAVVAWVDKDGGCGYFYEDELQTEVDDGHVHLDLGYIKETK